MLLLNRTLKFIIVVSQSCLVFPFTSSLKTSFSCTRYYANFGMQNDEAFGEKMQKKPSRFDTFNIIFSGCIGVEPKDLYLKNGHHVKSFPLAVVGHFDPLHSYESNKPSETMWIQAEIWDKLAEESSTLGKGSFLNGVGTMICDKWIDKNTGEEKKMLKLRILKLLSKEAVNGIVAAIRPEVSNDLELLLGTESTSALEVAKVSTEKLVLPEGMEDNVIDDVEDETFPAALPTKEKFWSKGPPKKTFY